MNHYLLCLIPACHLRMVVSVFICLLVMAGCADHDDENLVVQVPEASPSSQNVVNNNDIQSESTLVHQEDVNSSCIPDNKFDGGYDYFPVKADVSYASGFSIEYYKSYRVLTINETDMTDKQSFALVKCGAPDPDIDMPIISTPIRSAFLSSTTQYPSFIEFESVSKITGVAQTSYISSSEVLKHISENNVVEFAGNFEVGTEAVIESGPDVLLSNGFADPSYPKLMDLDIPVVHWMDWLETSELGRAEWLLVTGVLLNEEAAATTYIEDIAKRYNETVAIASKASEMPTALVGAAFQGTFYAPGGSSYIANLLRDANIRYIWESTPVTGSLHLDLEAVLLDGASADIWINAPAQWKTIDQGLNEDPRYGKLKSIKNANVWTHTRMVNEQGADDYFERAASRPDLLLADLIKITHPDLLNDHQIEWYKRLPE